MRALVRIAVAVETIHVAAFESGAVSEDLGKAVEKTGHSLRRVARRLQDELRREGGS